MEANNNKSSNFYIILVSIIIIILVIIAQIFIIPRLLEREVKENNEDNIDNDISYMQISFRDLKNEIEANKKDFNIMEEVKLENGLYRLLVQGDELDRIVLEIIGNKELDKVNSIYLITWNTVEGSENVKDIDTRYMVKVLNILFPKMEDSEEWVKNSLAELGSDQIVRKIDEKQIGLMSLDGFETVGLSILPREE